MLSQCSIAMPPKVPSVAFASHAAGHMCEPRLPGHLRRGSATPRFRAPQCSDLSFKAIAVSPEATVWHEELRGVRSFALGSQP